MTQSCVKTTSDLLGRIKVFGSPRLGMIMGPYPALPSHRSVPTISGGITPENYLKLQMPREFQSSLAAFIV